ncbi:hypothetical protein K435DRAFT_458053 [Dendrothele bispora CBS 962.96]|uniref:Uncharacterized protein n=1 Tax=Dendrothele bispora (strain CBS 962.96) TaxID=1314807 RepID=A0A4S8MCR1_DENBC|nr:hypothetical protein K435DRAFT_458053 [Dendrothele bispora CBS 962.96]
MNSGRLPPAKRFVFCASSGGELVGVLGCGYRECDIKIDVGFLSTSGLGLTVYLLITMLSYNFVKKDRFLCFPHWRIKLWIVLGG